ncbi:4'-phosphopantetheinyl transferase family protein [Clostridium saccharoperbutylacetonicum]|uniref:4'-phosphopantetheinyl transferase family protein n=1 Tax=Clostridium saccharoperbutylacetonicum TaxID=36745 RepID=UPI0039E89D32
MEIYVTKISDISKERIDKLCLFINPERKSKIERFINKEDKIRALVGEILIKTIMAETLGIKSKNIIFNKNEFGKPYLKNYEKFNFNISHSGEFTVCAIDDRSIGIDIEQIKQIEYKVIAERFFSTCELKYINNTDLCNQLKKFYEIWTLKESYIKCCGMGLSMPLNKFSIDLSSSEIIRVAENNNYKQHLFKLIDINSNYKMAVCSTNINKLNNITVIEQNSLINKYFKIA